MMYSGDATPYSVGENDSVGNVSPRGRKGIGGLPKPRKARPGGMKSFGKAKGGTKRATRRK